MSSLWGPLRWERPYVSASFRHRCLVDDVVTISILFAKRENVRKVQETQDGIARELTNVDFKTQRVCWSSPMAECELHSRDHKNRKNLRFNDDGDRSEIHRFDILHTIVTFSFSRATRIARFFDTHRRALISLDFLDQSLGRNRVGVKSRDQRIVLWIRSMQ